MVVQRAGMDTLPFAQEKPGPRPVPAWERASNHVEPVVPVKEQKARPYQMLMMKGLQLRAYNTADELDAAMRVEYEHGRHALSFKYCETLERYLPCGSTGLEATI